MTAALAGHLTSSQIAIAFAAFLIAGVVKGAVGVGQMSTAVAILGLGIDLRTAIPLLLVPALVSNYWQATRGSNARVILRRFAAANLVGGIGIVVGTAILFRVHPDVLSAALGLLIAVYAAANLARFDPVAPPAVERWATAPVAFVSGVLTGVTGSLHLLLAAWFAALRLPRDAFIQAVGLTLLIATLFWAAGLAWQGALTPSAILWSAAALIPTFAGMAAGSRLRDVCSEAAFRTALMIFLLVLSISLVWKAAA